MSRRWKVALAVLGVLALAFAINAVFVSRETQSAKSGDGRILRLAGGDLSVSESGSAKRRPPLVLLHGITAARGWWDEVRPRLARRYRVISIDLLGHGRSEKPSDGYSMENQGRLVGDAIRRLKAEHTIVVGHSMGGTVASALAERDPQLLDGLVMIDTPTENRFRELPLTGELATRPVLGQAIWQLSPDASIRSSVGEAFAEGFDVPDEFVRDVRGLTYTAYSQSYAKSGDFADAKPLDARVAASGLPLLVIFGTEDELVEPRSAESWKDGVRGARVELVRGAGHTPMVERPRVTAELILGFAREVAAEPPR